MSEQQAASTAQTTPCPWCSAPSPVGAETCPSCGAALVASADNSVPGVTAIDAEAVLRGRGTTRARGGLLGFLSGETGDTVDVPTAAELTSLAPPATDVRIEMMRLELEAERQRLEAEAAELAVDAVIDGEIASIPRGVVDLVENGGDIGMGPAKPEGPAPSTGTGPTGPAAAGSPPPS